MGNLRVNKTKGGLSVQGEVSIYEYEEDGIFYCISPELDIIGYDKTPASARESFQVQLEAFFEYASHKNCLDKELTRLGWIGSKPEFTAPSPHQLTESNDLYTELLARSSFSKNTTPVAYC
jgi:hypothetical protein